MFSVGLEYNYCQILLEGITSWEGYNNNNVRLTRNNNVNQSSKRKECEKIQFLLKLTSQEKHNNK